MEFAVQLQNMAAEITFVVHHRRLLWACFPWITIMQQYTLCNANTRNLKSPTGPRNQSYRKVGMEFLIGDRSSFFTLNIMIAPSTAKSIYKKKLEFTLKRKSGYLSNEWALFITKDWHQKFEPRKNHREK